MNEPAPPADFTKPAIILGGCLLLASVILVGGMGWVLHRSTDRLDQQLARSTEQLAASLDTTNTRLDTTNAGIGELQQQLARSTGELTAGLGRVDRGIVMVREEIDDSVRAMNEKLGEVERRLASSTEVLATRVEQIAPALREALNQPIPIRADEPLPIRGPGENGTLPVETSMPFSGE